MLTSISAIGGLVGLVFSVILLSFQTRAVARQTKISNSIAAMSAIRDSTTDLREIYSFFIDRPELRPYFYGAKPCPQWGRTRARVLTIAEMLADALESGHLATQLAPASESHDDWIDYCKSMLRTGPAFADLVRRYPAWWPRLHRLLGADTTFGCSGAFDETPGGRRPPGSAGRVPGVADRRSIKVDQAAVLGVVLAAAVSISAAEGVWEPLESIVGVVLLLLVAAYVDTGRITGKGLRVQRWAVSGVVGLGGVLVAAWPLQLSGLKPGSAALNGWLCGVWLSVVFAYLVCLAVRRSGRRPLRRSKELFSRGVAAIWRRFTRVA